MSLVLDQGDPALLMPCHLCASVGFLLLLKEKAMLSTPPPHPPPPPPQISYNTKQMGTLE